MYFVRPLANQGKPGKKPFKMFVCDLLFDFLFEYVGRSKLLVQWIARFRMSQLLECAF